MTSIMSPLDSEKTQIYLSPLFVMGKITRF
jgi:hypothetical protein